MAQTRYNFAEHEPQLDSHWTGQTDWEPASERSLVSWSQLERLSLWSASLAASAVTTVELYHFSLIWGGFGWCGGLVACSDHAASSYYRLVTRDRQGSSSIRLCLEKVSGGNCSTLWQQEPLDYMSQILRFRRSGTTLHIEYTVRTGQWSVAQRKVAVTDTDPLTGRYSGVFAHVYPTHPPGMLYNCSGGCIYWFGTAQRGVRPVHRVIDGNTGLRFAATTHEPTSDAVPVEENDYNALLVGDDEPVTVVDSDVIVIGVEHAVESPWWKRLYFGNPWQRNAASLWSTLAQSS